MVGVYHFVGLIFAAVRTHAHYAPYNQAYFIVRRSSMTTANIGPLINFPLYSTVIHRYKLLIIVRMLKIRHSLHALGQAGIP